MLGEIEYFLDSYALIALLSASENYKDIEISHGVTTQLNLMEVQYFLHRKGIKDQEIKDTLNYMLPMCVTYSPIDAFDSVKFRFTNKKQKLSYVDSLGYTLAKKRGIEFVTGDMQFEGMKNVRFLKA
jgi:predicted nucleic acid-binding protein